MSRCYACNDPLPIKPEECLDVQTGRYYCPHCWEKELDPHIRITVKDVVFVIPTDEELDEDVVQSPISDADLQSQLIGCCHFPGGSHTRQLIPQADTAETFFDPFYDVDELEDT